MPVPSSASDQLVAAGRGGRAERRARAPAPGCRSSSAERGGAAPRPGRAARPRRPRPARRAPARTRSARCSGRRRRGRPAPRAQPISRAVVSSGEPGSVTTTNRRPRRRSMPGVARTPASTPAGGCRSPPWRRTCWTTTTTVRSQPVGQRGARPGAGRWCRAPSAATPSGAGDHLGRQRRAAHAGQHHVVEAVGAARSRSSASCGSSVAAAAEGVEPAEPDLRLGLGLRPPQRGVLRGQQAGHAVVGQLRPGPRRRRRRPRRRRCDGQPAAAASSPRLVRPSGASRLRAASCVDARAARSRTPRTSPRPRAPASRPRRRSRCRARPASVQHLPAAVVVRRRGPCRRVTSPWSANAWMVASGIVLTTPGATSSLDVHDVAVGRVLGRRSTPTADAAAGRRPRPAPASGRWRRPSRSAGRPAGRWRWPPCRAAPSPPSVPILSSRLSISVSTRDTKNDATDADRGQVVAVGPGLLHAGRGTRPSPAS